MLHLAIPFLKPALLLGSIMRPGTNRQAELRRRRREAGWIEILVWVPRSRMVEIKAAVAKMIGKPPAAKRRAELQRLNGETAPTEM